MAKTQPKAKGRNTPRVAVEEKPKRVRPSRAKTVAASAPKANKTTTEAIAILDVIGKSHTADLLRVASGEDPTSGADPELLTPANSPIEASIAQNLGVYLLELEYKHYEDDSNMVAQLVKRNAQDANTHIATISLVVTDVTKYRNPANAGSGGGIIEVQDGIKLTEELKYYFNQAIYRFTASVDSRINVTRCVVQLYALPGIPFII